MTRPSKTREIWGMILEKAWAKVYGSYQRIEAGLTSEAMYPLTGCPSKYFMHNSIEPSRLWNYIKRSDKEGFVMCASIVS